MPHRQPRPEPTPEDEPLVTELDFKVMTSCLAVDRDLDLVEEKLDAIEKNQRDE